MKLNEDHIKDKIESLDDSFPEMNWTQQDLWGKVESKITKPKVRTFNYTWYAVAASVIICVSLANYFLNRDKEKISYAVVEMIPSVTDKSSGSGLDELTLDFIKESCLRDLQVCHTVEFKELKSQLDETSSEIDNLNDMILKYGDTPDLVRSKIKIENFRSEIMRQLVQIITS